MTFGEKLQALRTDAALSQEDLAAKLNVSRQAISKWELDKTVPDVKYIVELSELFQVTTDYLLKASAAKPCNVPKTQVTPLSDPPSHPEEEHSPAPEKRPAEQPMSQPPAARDLFPTAAVCAVTLMLAADLIFTAAHIFYLRELYTFSMIFLLLAMVFFPVLLAGWRIRLRITTAPANCRRIVSAGTRLWCFGLMLLCGFHQVIHDLFISPGILAFLDDFGLLILTFLAITLGLWAAGRLSALLFPKNPAP